MGHISCGCPKQLKLPVMEVKWLYYQREKVGERSVLCMGSADWLETKRLDKAEKRVKEVEEAAHNYTMRRKKEHEIMAEQFQKEDKPSESFSDVDISDNESDEEEEDSHLTDISQPPKPGELLFPDVPQETDEVGKTEKGKRKEVGKRNLLSIKNCFGFTEVII